jgi:hypothetical protein
MNKQTTSLGNERGSVLFVVLILLVLMSIFGTIALNATDTELRAAAKQKVDLQTFFAVEAGIAEAMRRLKETDSPDAIGDSTTPLEPNWSAYILTDGSWSSSDDPHYDSSLTNYIPTTSDATNTTVQANSKQGGISYVVRIRHKREYDAEKAGHTTGYSHYDDNDGNLLGNSSTARGNIVYYGYGDPARPTESVQFTTASATQHYPVEIITTYARRGNSLKAAEVEVVRNPGIAVIGAIYSEGNVTGNGNSATISGFDNCGVVADLPAIYTLDPATTSITGGTVDGLIEHGPDDLDLGSYIDILRESTSSQITLNADVNGETYGNPGDFVTVYSETSGNVGGLKMSNVDGFGNLIIDGDLTLGGGFNWTGLVVVTGTVTYNGGGNGVNITGAVMSGDAETLNGGLEIYYDSCAVGEALSALNYQMINWRPL